MNMSTNMENETIAYRLETSNAHPSFQEGSCQRAIQGLLS